jgi:phytoene desaturase
MKELELMNDQQEKGEGRRAESGSLAVAVIGGGLGGLSAAIHLRLAGHAVTLYEANDSVGGRANLLEREGYRFDTGPSLLNYPWVFEELFEAAGRRLQDYLTLLPVDPSISFQWPDGTHLALSSNLPNLLAEFERVEPGSRPQTLAFLRDGEAKYRMAFDHLVTRNEGNLLRWFAALSFGGLLKSALWRSMDDELRRFFRSSYIREALGSYAMYLGSPPTDLPGLFSILPYGELAYGLWLPKGGIYALVAAVERLALELGVRIRTDCRVEKIVTRHGAAAGLRLESGEQQPAEVIVTNVDVPTSDTELLDAAEVGGRLRRRAAKMRMTPGVMTFYWGIRGKVDNLGHHTVFLPEDFRGAFDELLKAKRIPRRLPFYVAVPSATDPDLAPTGGSTLFVLVPTPLVSEMPQVDWPRLAHTVKKAVLSRLSEHGIKLTDHRFVVDEVYTPADWQRRFGLYKGSAFGAAHTLGQVGPLRARNYSREVKGLYYVGASTTPGTGLPMVVLGGRMTAERILASYGSAAGSQAMMSRQLSGNW